MATKNPSWRTRAKAEWVSWLKSYGLGKFYDAFVELAQDAESVCVYCDQQIYLDIIEGGGVPDWRTSEGDYGCSASPETTEEGVGGHKPKKLE